MLVHARVSDRACKCAGEVVCIYTKVCARNLCECIKVCAYITMRACTNVLARSCVYVRVIACTYAHVRRYNHDQNYWHPPVLSRSCLPLVHSLIGKIF